MYLTKKNILKTLPFVFLIGGAIGGAIAGNRVYNKNKTIKSIKLDPVPHYPNFENIHFKNFKYIF